MYYTQSTAVPYSLTSWVVQLNLDSSIKFTFVFACRVSLFVVQNEGGGDAIVSMRGHLLCSSDVINDN